MDKQEKIAKILHHAKQILEILVPEDTEVAEDPLKEFTDLRFLMSAGWPLAVDPDTIVNVASEEEKFERAEGLIEILLPDVKDLKFLDYGCGEGHLVNKVAEKAALAIGYDKEAKFIPNTHLTTDFEEIRSSGPYDVILLCDVLDHAESPIDVLNACKSVLNASGRIIARCHP